MTDSSDISSAAKEMAARFAGSEGPRFLRDLIRRQALTQGKSDVVDQLVAIAKIESYETGEVIIRQGGTDTDIFFILSGSVKININGRDDAERRAGTHIGEMATIDPAAQCSNTVYASAPTIVARVNEPDFSRIADAHPFIWRHFARELADRLRQRVAKGANPQAEPARVHCFFERRVENCRGFESGFRRRSF
jgi:CRP/FNR family transcriptional regulator, cyclic AMP receptor protein